MTFQIFLKTMHILKLRRSLLYFVSVHDRSHINSSHLPHRQIKILKKILVYPLHYPAYQHKTVLVMSSWNWTSSTILLKWGTETEVTGTSTVVVARPAVLDKIKINWADAYTEINEFDVPKGASVIGFNIVYKIKFGEYGKTVESKNLSTW